MKHSEEMRLRIMTEEAMRSADLDRERCLVEKAVVSEAAVQRASEAKEERLRASKLESRVKKLEALVAASNEKLCQANEKIRSSESEIQF